MASGIEVAPPSESDSAMEEICEKANASDKEHQNLSQVRKEKIGNEKEAEEIRNKALERIGETMKRQQVNEGSTKDVKPGRRKRRSGSEALEYLREQLKLQKGDAVATGCSGCLRKETGRNEQTAFTSTTADNFLCISRAAATVSAARGKCS